LEKIVLFEDSMIKVCEICAEIDCLLSFAEASRAYNYTRPQMVSENIINIKQGRCDRFQRRKSAVDIRLRHPLQEQVVDSFVPNDTYLVGGLGNTAPAPKEGAKQQASVAVLTGANSCGKVSVLIVAVGLT
jgi:DNA mismatch repair protein MSH5